MQCIEVTFASWNRSVDFFKWRWDVTAVGFLSKYRMTPWCRANWGYLNRLIPGTFTLSVSNEESKNRSKMLENLLSSGLPAEIHGMLLHLQE